MPIPLTVNAEVIASCLLDSRYVSFRPVAVVVLQSKSDTLFYSDGLVYVNKFEEIANEALEWHCRRYLHRWKDLPRLFTKPHYKLIMML